MANPISVPGSVVPSGSLISPGGAQGLQGLQGTTALADSTKNGLLRQVSGNTTDFIDGTNNSQPIAPQIWSARLRSFNALSASNPTFEVDQRMTGGTMSANGSIFVMDRWLGYNNTGVQPSCGQASGQATKLPGTNFRISQGLLNFSTLSVSKPSLAIGDQLLVQSTVEGAVMRELIDDVHSISILATTNVVGGLKFAVALRDSGATRSLVKLCTIPSPNVMTLIQLPNIPIWGSGGGWSVAPGAVGYTLTICLAAGSNVTTPANDVWQNGSFIGAVGMDNILSKPSNSSLQIAFIQHEPGAQCTTPIDCPFGQNLDGDMGCLRYFCKSYDYATAIGTATLNGISSFTGGNSHASVWGSLSFAKRMAKVPSATMYNPGTGAVNSVKDAIGNFYTVSSPTLGQSGIAGFNISPALGAAAAGMPVWLHYTADTGW